MIASFAPRANRVSARFNAAEIIGQVWLAIDSYDGWQAGKGRVVTNVVMMGMGEPLLNFDNVVSSMELMCDDLAYGLSKRKVTLSTSVSCLLWTSLPTCLMSVWQFPTRAQ